MEAWSLNHWTSGEIPRQSLFKWLVFSSSGGYHSWNPHFCCHFKPSVYSPFIFICLLVLRRRSLVAASRATLCCSAWPCHRGDFSCGAQALANMGSIAATWGLESIGLVVVLELVAPQHVESSWIGDQTHVPCIAMAGGFLPTVPPGKSLFLLILLAFLYHQD